MDLTLHQMKAYLKVCKKIDKEKIFNIAWAHRIGVSDLQDWKRFIKDMSKDE